VSAVSRGNGFENEVANNLEASGWVVASLRHRGGAGDLLALHRDGRRWLIECKTTARGPFADYLPTQRQEALDCARRHDLTPWVVWRAPGKPTRWIPVEGWPEIKEGTNGTTLRVSTE
jgi:Holliday junction resolvase